MSNGQNNKFMSHVSCFMSHHASSAEGGRSMIEMLGVLAIAAVLAVGAFKTYSVLRERQARMVAVEDMRDIAKNSRILFGHRGSYDGISKKYLIDAGAIKNSNSPIPNTKFEIRAKEKGFAMLFSEMDFKTCAWMSTVHLDFADSIAVRGRECLRNDRNEVVVFVR